MEKHNPPITLIKKPVCAHSLRFQVDCLGWESPILHHDQKNGTVCTNEDADELYCFHYKTYYVVAELIPINNNRRYDFEVCVYLEGEWHHLKMPLYFNSSDPNSNYFFCSGSIDEISDLIINKVDETGFDWQVLVDKYYEYTLFEYSDGSQ